MSSSQINKKVVIICPAIWAISCGGSASPVKHKTETKKVIVKEVLKTTAKEDHEDHTCFTFFAVFFFIAIGSFLQYVGLWSGLASKLKWLATDSYKDLKAWFRRQEGEEQ